MKRCIQCGKTLNEKYVFCPNCGRATKKIKIGDPISFGKWNDQSINWIVLNVYSRENRALLISEKILEDQKYHNVYNSITWENCSLRYYLQNEFMEKTFNLDERKRIIPVKNINKANRKYGTEGGNPTWDKVFLLSIEEIKRYFKTDEEKIAEKIDDNDTWSYWLRSPGISSNYAADVHNYGNVNEHGFYVDSPNGVRPAFWLQI